MSSSQNTTSQSRGWTGALRSSLVITNLPPTADAGDLIDHLTVLGPFGKLYAAVVEKRENLSKPGTQVVQAMVTFFKPESARNLLDYINGPCISMFQTHILQARWAKETDFIPSTLPDPEDDIKINPSRVLLVTGPKEDVTMEFLDYVFEVRRKDGLEQYHKLLQVESEQPDDEAAFVIMFNTYPAAKLALKILHRRRVGMIAEYTRDPIASGVIRRRTQPNIEGDSTAFTSYKDWTLVGESEWVGSGNSKRRRKKVHFPNDDSEASGSSRPAQSQTGQPKGHQRSSSQIAMYEALWGK